MTSEQIRHLLTGLAAQVPTIMDKSLGTLLRFWGVFQCAQFQPPPLTPHTMLDACIQNLFRVSTFYGVGGGRTARKFRKGCTVLTGKREMTEKYEYCSTVPRTFVQDCSFFFKLTTRFAHKSTHLSERSVDYFP